jgi:uncharacterized protein (TIGR03790 family)
MAVMRMGLAILPVVLCATAIAQGPENVLLVVNKRSKDSQTVAEYYRERRGIPSSNVCTIKTLDQEEIQRVFYEDEIRKPIAECLTKGRLQDQVLYIVLTKGVPIKVKGEEGQKDDHASVDSELTLLYSEMLGLKPHLPGSISNPYYAAHAAGKFVRFSHRDFPMYLVTRLDGYDVADVRALINRGMRVRRSPMESGQAPTAATEPQGRFVLDLNYDDQSDGNRWLREAAAALKQAGVPESRIELETSQKFLTGEKDVLGYASWGSNDRANPARVLGNTWLDGALASEYVSTNGRTFERPPANWKTGQWSDPPGTFFAGSPQGLIADYIHEGVTGIAGNVYEPYLQACARPQILLPAYVRGHNLAESFYAALPYLSWQTVVVGDPLTAPFAGPLISTEELHPPLDPATRLPRYFAARLAAAQVRSKNNPSASSGSRAKSKRQ